MMPRDQTLRHLQPEFHRLLAMCLAARVNAVSAVWDQEISHALSLWLSPSGKLSSVRTFGRDVSGRAPLRVLKHTSEAHEKMRKYNTLGYSQEDLIINVWPAKVMFKTHLHAWLMAGNHTGLGERLPLADATALIGVPAQGRPGPLVDSATVYEWIKTACRQQMERPRLS